MNKKIIIIVAVLLILGGIGFLYGKNGAGLKGMFINSKTAKAPEPVSVRTRDGSIDMPITQGKFVAMLAKTVMADDEKGKIPARTGNCAADIKNYKYEAYLNYACQKGWIRTFSVNDPITRKQAAILLGTAFRIPPANYNIFNDIHENSVVNTLGAVGIFEEVKRNSQFRGEELLGEETAKNWIKNMQ